MPKIVSVMLDKERHVKVTIGTMIAFKKETGLQVESLGDIGSLDLEKLVTLARLSMSWEDPELTDEKVADMLGMAEIKAFSQALSEVMGEDPFPANGPQPSMTSASRRRK